MPMSSGWLRHEDVLEHARNTIRPTGWQCEWNVAAFNKPVLCKTMLVSWNAYLKHLLNHCQQDREVNRSHSYACRLPRCSIPSGVPISSYKEIISHLTLSHLNRSSLQCPVKGCDSLLFRGPAALQTHFDDVHSALLNQIATMPFDLLLPSWIPFRPPGKVPPAIPKHIPPGSILIPPVEGSWRARPTTPRRLSSGRSKFASPKKPSKMDAPTNANLREKNDDKQEPEEIVFDDLPHQLDDQKCYFRKPDYECIIREKGPWFDVSRPQPLLDPNVFGYRRLPETILYDAWVRQNQDILDQEDEEEEGKGGADNNGGASAKSPDHEVLASASSSSV